MTTITINQPNTKTEEVEVKSYRTIDITPNPWFPLILAGRYEEAEKMKAAVLAKKGVK